jgi:hypothetical protein
MDFSALDEELARMAEETPEVPEDFHENWTRMIREEAAAGKPEAETAAPRKGRGQLRYILSAAAAFVILVGGVVIARNNGLLQGKTSAPETQASAANMLMAEDTVQEAAEAVYDEAEQAGFPEMSADSMPAPEMGLLSAKAADKGAALEAEAAEGTQASAPAVPMPAATAEPTERPVLLMGSAAVETDEAPETGAAGSEPADMAAGGAETEETEAAEEAAEESAEAPAAETAEDSTEEDARSFLQQAWEGLLGAVPWILGGAIIVLFILTYVVRPGGKK